MSQSPTGRFGTLDSAGVVGGVLVFLPPVGELDNLETLEKTGTGGAVPDANSTTPGTASFNITISERGVVNLVELVSLDTFSYPFASDLSIKVTSPEGTQVRITHRPGNNTTEADDDFSGDYSFNDTAATRPLFASNTVTPGTYRSYDALSAMIGESVTGTWVLTITDYGQGGTGTLGSWGLRIQIAPSDHGISTTPDPLPTDPVIGSYRSFGSKTISGDGSGTWPTVLPKTPAIFRISVPDIGTVSELVAVYLYSFNHFDAGDVHVVLQSPEGTKITIFHRPGSTSGSAGNIATIGDGTFIFTKDKGTLLPDSGAIPPGTYLQDVGDWPGTGNDENVGAGTFEDFAGEKVTGMWTLYIYDWDALGNGTITDVTISIAYFE